MSKGRPLGVDDLLNRLSADGCRRPLTMTAELTYRCNFTCRHCYCRLPRNGPTPRPELSTADWDRLFAESAAAGVLLATFTGGEPLLRDDFRDLWLAARRRGILAELFSNASLVDADMAGFLADWPPRQVSVTLYAATEQTWRHMTGHSGMLDRVLRGLDLLREREVAVEIKVIVTRGNVHELPQLRGLSARYQETFRWDAELTGCFPEGGGSPEAERLTPEQVLELELQDETRMAEWRAQLQDWQPPDSASPRLFHCRVGQRDFHIDPYGAMHPCMMLPTLGYDLLAGSVSGGWERLPGLLEELTPVRDQCLGCPLPQVCRCCPAHALLAGAQAGAASAFLCELGHRRAAALGLTVPPRGLTKSCTDVE